MHLEHFWNKKMNPSSKITKSMREIDVQKEWVIVDATDQTLGRLASQIASILRGKHRAFFTPHIDCGDYVVVINAEKINIAQKREEMKEYFRYSGYPGGLKVRTYKAIKANKPELLIEYAVRGMLPKNTLGREIIKKLRVYRGTEHPHDGQKPVSLNLKYSNN